MACEWVPPDPTKRRLSDLSRELGDEIHVAWLKKYKLDVPITPLNTHGLIICGTWTPAKPCSCGKPSGYLCDEPMGQGKTCSAPICEEHRTAIGEDLDLCPVHALRPQQRSLF